MRKATAAKPAPSPETDEAPELIVDREFKSPQPLDRNICTVSLKTPTNEVTEGYDLHLSATFGKERVTLISDEFVIDVEFSMNKANVELSFHRCDHAEINDNPRVEEYRRTITEHGGKHTNVLAKLTGRLSGNAAGLTGKAEVDGSVHRSATASVTMKQEIVRHDWHRLGTDAIALGPTGHYLQGPMITDFRGWRVTPHDSNDISGVIARVKVREPWINFDKPQILKHPPGLLEKVQRLMGDHRRKKYFALLLRHLMMQTELRHHQNGVDAIIASHVLLVRPHKSQAMSQYLGESRRQVKIDDRRIELLLTADEGHEASALIALGLDPDLISPIASDEPSRPKRGSFFIPDSTPPHALATFKDIYARRSIPKGEAQYPTALHDLRALKLIESDGDYLIAIPKPHLDPEILLRRAVSGMECINITRQVLRIKPHASAVEVAEAVALELGKNWPTLGSKRRNGGAIMRYAVWLEPHLLDESTSSEAAYRIAYALETNPTPKGRPQSLMRKHEAELRRLLADGLSNAAIGRHFNVSPATIRNWRIKLGLM